MEKIKWPIFIVSAFNLFYQLSPAMGIPDNAIIAMYIIAPLLVLWMVYKILKDGTPSDKTFDEYFYEDYEYKRNSVSNDPFREPGDLL